jgi:N-acetylglucosaminyl-diphospho-decaprenol L-rhamnosyltransferase
MLVACLERLTDSAIGRIIVVDDVSGDGTVDAVRAAFPDVRVAALDEHRGLAYAWNRGAKLADAEFLLFLNNDVFAVDNAVARLVQALAEEPGAVSAGGRLVDPGSRHTQDSYRPRAIPGLRALTARLLGIERYWKANPWTGQHLRRRLDDDATVRTNRQPAGGCLLVRRSAFDAVGGWDERYWIWYEDVDLSRRLLEGPGYALYVPQAMFEHVGAASTGAWARHERHRRLYHGTLQYASAHLTRGRRALFGLVVMAVALPRLALLTDPEARDVYNQVFRGGFALLCNREPPSLMRPQRTRQPDAATGDPVSPAAATGDVVRG